MADQPETTTATPPAEQPTVEAPAPAATTAAAAEEPAAPHTQTAPIEADPAADVNDDADSSLGDDAASSTATIASSILRYRQENGRTYHAYKDGKYVIPNDDQEQERLDLQHHLCLITLENKLHLCPAGSDGRPLEHVLDVGTGTGVWAIDFADEHPETQVIGVDLSPIQPQFVPPNLSFQVDDLEEPWVFSHDFDFIYSRMMTASFANWPRFFEQSFANLRPGGWLETMDIYPVASDDGTLAPDTSLYKWLHYLLDGTKVIGRSFDGASQYKQQMEAAGFVNVKQVIYKWPQNRWPKDPKLKELGSWTLENIGSGLEGLSLAIFTRVLNWSKEETDVLLAKVRRDMKDTKIHAYWPIYVVYGQKPA